MEKRKEIKEQKKEEQVKKELITNSSQGLEKKFDKALKIIRKTTIYEQKNNLSRHELPWYLVLGCKNTAKTSVIQKSGINFPLNNNTSKFEEDIVDDPFDSLDFWYGENAIFLDTNGELIYQETPEYKHIWGKLIHLLKTKRTRRPINGIILTIDANSLQDKSAKEREELSIIYRLRLEELTNKFFANIPIYLIITKTDSIKGFEDYFSHLPKEKMAEVFGCNFDDSIQNITPDMLEDKMNDIIANLNLNSISLMHKEWSPQIRSKILQLPQELSQITVNLKSIIEATFTENRYHKPLRIRGVYFTSTKDNKTMFLNELLSDVILKERNIITMHRNFKIKYITKQYTFYSACIASILIISLYFLNYTNNFFKTSDVLQKDFLLYKKNKDKLKQTHKFISTLYILNPIYNSVHLFQKNQKYDFWKPGFYRLPQVSQELNAIYYDALKTQLIQKTNNVMEDNILKSLDNEYELWFNTKIYLMTAYKQFRDNKQLENYMYKYWYTTYPSNKVVRDSLNTHFKNLIAYGLPESALNKDVYNKSKSVLGKTNLSHLIYYKMKERYKSLQVKSFQFSSLLDSDVNVFDGDNYKIPAFYTKASFNLIFIKGGISVIKSLAQENWVAGYDNNISQKEFAKLYMQVMNLYLYDYKTYWQKAISKLEVKKYNNLEQNSVLISQLSGLDSPIIKVVRELKRQTTLLQLSSHKLEEKMKNDNLKVLKGLKKYKLNPFDLLPTDIKNMLTDTQNHFADVTSILTNDNKLSTKYSKVPTYLNNLNNEISLVNESSAKNSYALDIVKDRALNKHPTIVYINNQLPRLERKWLETATRNTWNVLFNMAYTSINNAYKTDIYDFYKRSFVGKYPLALGTAQDVSIDNFNDMFKKNGTMDGFISNYLKPFLTEKHGTFFVNTIDREKLKISSKMINSLNLISKIQQSYFDKNGALQVSFKLSPLRLSNNVRSTKLTYGKTVVNYSHGPVYSYKFDWLTSGIASKTAKFILLDDNLTVLNHMEATGDWALFKLIQQFDMTNSSQNNNIRYIILSKDMGSKHVKFILNGDIINLISQQSILSNFKLNPNL